MEDCAEKTSSEAKISREAQDEYAIQSNKRSATTWKNDDIGQEIVPVTVQPKKETITEDTDEEFSRADFEKFKTLKTVFQKENDTITATNASITAANASITAVNASTLNDGACSALLSTADKAKELEAKPLAKSFDAHLTRMTPKSLRRPDISKEKLKIIQLASKRKLYSWKNYVYHIQHNEKAYDKFVCHRVNKEGIEWCDGSIRKWKHNGKIVEIKQHKHSPEPDFIKSIEQIEILKKSARERPWEKPRVLIGELNLDPISALHMPKKKTSIARIVSREQNKLRLKIKAKNLADIDLDALRNVLSPAGEPLFVGATDFKKGRRVLVFSTTSCLEVLKNCETLSVDGTFKARPKLFKKGQVWSIHGKVRDCMVPLVVTLTTHKSKTCYKEVLSLLPDLINLKYVLADFEQAEGIAFLEVYPEVIIFGCYFHFTKCINSQFVLLGWKLKNRETPETPFLKIIERFLFLPFCPLQHMSVCYDNMLIVLEEADADPLKIEKFKDYFEETWMGYQDENNRPHLLEEADADPLKIEKFKDYFEETWMGYQDENNRPHPPKYAHDRWNCLESFGATGFRTTCSHESWNRHFTESLNCSGRPALSRFVEVLRNEQTHIALKIAEAERQAYPELSQRNHLLEEAVGEFGRYKENTNDFFDRIRTIFKETRQ